MSPTSPISFAVPRLGVGLIRIDRPDRRNALNLEVKRDIVFALDRLSEDESVKAIVIAGSRDVFVAGTDLEEMATMTPESHGKLETNRLFEALRGSRLPLLAAVEGYALGGGCELALSCDIVVASEAAQFGQPEIRVGIMPGAGGTQWLPRLAGRQRGLLLLLTGQMFSAKDAYDMGLASELVDPGQAQERALELAETIARMPPLGVSGIREAVAHGLDHGVASGLLRERELFEGLFATADQKEGMRAFLEKRRPAFTGT